MYFILVQDLKKTTELKSTNKEFYLSARYLGLLDYSTALNTQYQLHQKISEEKGSFILGVEHPAVLTLGYRAEQEKEIPVETGLPVVKVERGGLATIHSEGQLVIYPIINLKAFDLGVRNYVSLLLKTTKQLLLENDIESECFTEAATGLFTKRGKIAFCGIQVKNGISLHGISLNVNNDLSLFNAIVPCGIRQQKMDRVANYKNENNLESLFNRWVEIFNYNIQEPQLRSRSC